MNWCFYCIYDIKSILVKNKLYLETSFDYCNFCRTTINFVNIKINIFVKNLLVIQF